MLLLFSLMVGAIQAQFINNGATVTIQSGATLRVETDFTNTSGGIITNSGTIEVQGNLLNSATITSNSGSTVRFIGTTNSNVTSGGAVLRNVEMAKTAPAENITLLDPMAVAGVLNFPNANNRVVLGANNLTVQSTGSVTNAAAGKYVATTGAGKLIKSVGGAGTVNMEVGDATNYTPVSNVITGSAFSSATLSARVLTTGLTTKYVGTTDFIAREWQVETAGITGYANTMTGTYVAGDVTGSAALIKGATFHTADWFFNGSAGNGSTTVTASTTNTNVRLSGKNFFGKANLIAFLQGAYSGGAMTTTLNTSNLIPLTSPYLDAPATVASIPSGVTDWVRLELRDPSAPTVATGYTASAFIKSDGTIVGLDGTSLPSIKNGFATSVVVLSHRNHLPIRTVNTGLDVVNPTLHNFSTGLGQAFVNVSNSVNNAMVDLGSGTYGLWSGDINANNNVRYSGSANDNNVLLNTILGGNKSLILSSVYSLGDLNMNGNVRYSGSANDNNVLLNSVLSGNKSVIYNAHL